MRPNSFQFRGHPEYVVSAAEKLGRPELAGEAGRTMALHYLAALCAQAVASNAEQALDILGEAARFRDQLHIALQAAEAMLSDIEYACGLAPAPSEKPSRDTPQPEANRSPHQSSKPHRRHNP